MTIQEHINYWLASAEYDLNAADSLFQAGYNNWCLFLGHLVLEKTLKALFVQTSNNLVPPKIHNLLKLALLSNLELTEKQSKFFADVNRFNIEGRYAEFKQELFNISTKDFTYIYFEKIKEQFQWLKSQLK